MIIIITTRSKKERKLRKLSWRYPKEAVIAQLLCPKSLLIGALPAADGAKPGPSSLQERRPR